MTLATRTALIVAAAVLVLLVLGVALYLWGLSGAAAVTGAAALGLGTAGGGAYRSAQRTEAIRRELEAVAELEADDAELVAARDRALMHGTPRERNAVLIAEARRRRDG